MTDTADDRSSCMHQAAGVGVALWVVGALLWFVVPGGLWSDVPGGLLLVVGVLIELAFGVAIVIARLTRSDR